MWRLWFKKLNCKSNKISLEFNQENNDLIYQIITLFVEDIPKEIMTFCMQFAGMKVTLKI